MDIQSLIFGVILGSPELQQVVAKAVASEIAKANPALAKDVFGLLGSIASQGTALLSGK